MRFCKILSAWVSLTITIHIFNTSIKIEAFVEHYFEIEMRLNLLMSFAYCYDYPIEIFVACTLEGQVSRGDERYLYFILL